MDIHQSISFSYAVTRTAFASCSKLTERYVSRIHCNEFQLVFSAALKESGSRVTRLASAVAPLLSPREGIAMVVVNPSTGVLF